MRLLAIFLSMLLAAEAVAAGRPSFVVILADNLGKDWFGCYGAAGGHTPHIDNHLVWTGALVGEGLAEARWKASITPGGKRELESRYWDPVSFRNGQPAVSATAHRPDASRRVRRQNDVNRVWRQPARRASGWSSNAGMHPRAPSSFVRKPGGALGSWAGCVLRPRDRVHHQAPFAKPSGSGR